MTDFPNNPAVGDKFTNSAGVTYVWDGTKWVNGVCGSATPPVTPSCAFQSPWLCNIDGANFNLSRVKNLSVDNPYTASFGNGVVSSSYVNSLSAPGESGIMSAGSVYTVSGRGTVASPAAVQVGDYIGNFSMAALTATGQLSTRVTGATISAVAKTIGYQLLGADMLLMTSDGSTTTSLTERMRITSTGQVGIANTAPAYPLDVVGSINTTGCYLINGATFACSDGASGINLTNVTNINGAPPGTGGGGMTQSPWLSNINAAYFSLNSVSNIVVATTSGNPYIMFDMPTNAQGGVFGPNWSGLAIGGSAYGSLANALVLQNLDASAPIVFTAGSGAERMRITAAGNVGIGASIPASLLDVAGNLNLSGAISQQRPNAGNSLNMGFDTTNNVGFIQAVTYGTANRPLVLGGGDIRFVTAYPGGDISSGSANIHMFISSNSNVGIGTTTPSAQLMIVSPSMGAAAGSSSYAVKLLFTDPNADQLNFVGYRYGGTDWTGVEWRIQRQVDNSYMGYIGISNMLTFATGNGTERMRIAPDGSVGIGNTAPPSIHLSVIGVATSYPTLGSIAGGSVAFTGDSATWGLLFGQYSNGDSWIQSQRFDSQAVAYNILLNPSGGRVGIGTVNPGTSLEVVSPGNGVDGLRVSTPASSAHYIYLKAEVSASTMEIGSWAGGVSGDLSISARNVGIGTPTPATMLDVRGVASCNILSGQAASSYSACLNVHENLGYPAAQPPMSITFGYNTSTNQLIIWYMRSDGVSKAVFIQLN